MVSRYISLICLCLPSIVLASTDSSIDKRDIYLREAFFHASQSEYIDAISHLDVALGRVGGLDNPRAKSLHFRIGESQYMAGDFELSYRMYDRVKRSYEGVVNKNFYQTIRNEAAFHLANIYMQEGDSETALARISRVAEAIADDVPDEDIFLRAQIYMATGNYPEAIDLFRKLENSLDYGNFAAYNLGVALLQSGQEEQGLAQLDRLGKTSGNDEVGLALKDKANLLLGSIMLENNQPEMADGYFNRVRVTGPYSNKALLGSGWADVAQGHIDQALTPWNELSKRKITDRYVQESLLGVSYAYAKLNLPGRANLQYSKAIEAFDKEIAKLDASIKSVREGSFINALLRMKLKSNEDWAVKFSNLEQTPETQYLLELLASGDFRLLLDNYVDLDGLANKLEEWERYLDLTMAGSGQSALRGNKNFRDEAQHLKNRIQEARKKAGDLLSNQGRMIETMVIEELDNRRKNISARRVQAGIGVIESFEHAENPNVPPKGAE